MQMQTNPCYENLQRTKSIKTAETDQSHPYRTEMSLVLSYNGNKSKYSTLQNLDKTHESDTDTPPPNLPHAMKLLPNKLTYTSKNEPFIQIPIAHEITPINANESSVLTKSQTNLTNDHKKSNIRTEISNNGNNHESECNGHVINSTSLKDDEINSMLKTNNSNETHDSVMGYTKF